MKLVKSKRQRGDFIRDEKAATAVEFAMVAPLFFLMLGVVLETGLMMFTEYVLQTSVQEAARLVRTGQAQEQKMTAARFKDEVCDLAGIIIDCKSDVTVYMRADTNFTTLTANVPSFLSIGPGDDGTPGAGMNDCGAPSESVALIATYDWDFSIPYFMSFLGNRKSDSSRRMAGFAMFKNEPFPAVAGNVCS
jgi:Flp pilus assembly protein TadG